MVYLDILMGFSLVMLVFASGVSVVQTFFKRMLAIKGRAVAGPLLDEVRRAWMETETLRGLGDAAWAKVRRALRRSLTSRRGALGGALRNIGVDDGGSILRLVLGEGARVLAEEERAQWDVAIRKLAREWGGYRARLRHSYEVHTRLWVVGISLAATLAFNVDAVRIVRVLSVAKETRGELAKLAEKADAGGDLLPANLSEWQRHNLAELGATGLPLGWEKAPLWVCDGRERLGHVYGGACGGAVDTRASVLLWLVRVLGLLIAAGLIAQGAPFWYSVLDTVLGLKKKDAKEPPEPASDAVELLGTLEEGLEKAAAGGEVK